MFRSKDLLGRYTSAGGVNTYEARGVLNSNGFAQGSLVPIAGGRRHRLVRHVLPRHVPDRAHPGAHPRDVAGRLADLRHQRGRAGGRRVRQADHAQPGGGGVRAAEEHRRLGRLRQRRAAQGVHGRAVDDPATRRSTRRGDRPQRVAAGPGVGVEPRPGQPLLVAHRPRRLAAADDRQGGHRPVRLHEALQPGRAGLVRGGAQHALAAHVRAAAVGARPGWTSPA